MATPTASSSSKLQSRLARFSMALVWLYGAVLVAVMLVRHGVGDRTSLSFDANSLLLYAFLPSPILALVAWIRRDRAGLVIAGLSALLFLWHWGPLFVPTNRKSGLDDQTIRVMTYNALGYNPDTAGTIRAVREVDADIVAFQELAPEHAAALEREFSTKYPYRLMDARPGVTGCGILSRYPLRKIDAGPLDRLPWIGTPMANEIEMHWGLMTFDKFHPYAVPM